MSQVSELIAYIQRRVDSSNEVIKVFRKAKLPEKELLYESGREHTYKEVLEYIEDYFDGV